MMAPVLLLSLCACAQKMQTEPDEPKMNTASKIIAAAEPDGISDTAGWVQQRHKRRTSMVSLSAVYFFEVPVMYNVLHQYAQSIYDFSGAGRKHNAGEYQNDNNKEPDPRRRNMPTGVSHKIPLLFQQCHLLTNGGIHKITERKTCINRRKVRTRLRSVIIAK